MLLLPAYTILLVVYVLCVGPFLCTRSDVFVCLGTMYNILDMYHSMCVPIFYVSMVVYM